MADKIPLWLPSEGALRTYTVGATTPYVTIIPDVTAATFDSNPSNPGALTAGTAINLPNLKGAGRFAKIRLITDDADDTTSTCTFKVYGRIRVDYQAHQIQGQFIRESQDATRNVYQWALLRDPGSGATSHTCAMTGNVWRDGTYTASPDVLIDLEGVETAVAIPTSESLEAGASFGALQLRVLDK